MDARVLRWLSVAVASVLAVVFVAGIFLPVYSDEIGWRFQERAGFEGVDKMFSEVCGLNTLAAPPWFMMPVRWYSAFFNGAFADPFWIRVSGILYALAWIALLLLLVKRLTDDRHDRAVASIIGLGLLALGTMPLLMVWSRPEQPIMLAALTALVITFADGPTARWSPSNTRQAWLRSLGIVALACIAISYHVKGLFLLPLLLACLFFASRGPKANIPRGVSALLMLAATVSAMSYWRHRLDCPENQVLSMGYNTLNLSERITDVSSFAQVHGLLRDMMDNISIFHYVANVGPRPNPLSHWLEYDQISRQAAFDWFAAMAGAWTIAMIAAGTVVAVSVVSDLRRQRLEPRVFLAILALVTAIAWSAMQPVRNAYESKFVLPLLVLAIVLVLSLRSSRKLRPWLTATAGLIGLFALVSPLAIGTIYAPSLARAASQEGYIKAQPYSVSVFRFSRLKPQIAAAAKLCGIDDPSKAHAVMIDDVTYFAFIRSSLPQHQLGVIGGWNGEIKDPIGYLKGRDSDGAVVSCPLLDADMRARAKSVGSFCCLGPPRW